MDGGSDGRGKDSRQETWRAGIRSEEVKVVKGEERQEERRGEETRLREKKGDESAR